MNFLRYLNPFRSCGNAIVDGLYFGALVSVVTILVMVAIYW
jgi:hypothetical protein